MSRKKKITKKDDSKNISKKRKEAKVFLNKLLNYPESFKSDNMIQFPQILHENFENKISENLKSVIFMVFGFSKKIIEPLLKKNIKTILFSDSGEFLNQMTDSEENPKFPNFKHFYPPKILNNVNASFHPKLFILKFNNFLRVVIGSANLFNEDWSYWNNIIWMKDFYLKENNETEINNNFKNYLKSYIEQIMDKKFNLLKKFLDINLNNYNIEENKIHLIGSLPNITDITKTIKKENLHGLLLVKSITKLNPPIKPFTLSNTDIYYTTSSLGAINFNFIYEFITSFIPSLKKNYLTLTEKDKKKYLSIFHCIYPTEEYVNLSLNGYNDTPLFFKKEFFDNIRFEKSILYKYEGKGDIDGDNGVVSHVKLMVIMKNNVICDDSIIYLGSHNFTKAAWGKFVKNYKFYRLSNYELGVLIPSSKGSAKMKKEILDKISFKIPAEKYDEDDSPYLV